MRLPDHQQLPYPRPAATGVENRRMNGLNAAAQRRNPDTAGDYPA